jgi:Skp family chaperone for outer membrane proteins
MPITEIDETELLQLRQLQGIARKMAQNPKAAKLFEQAHKEIDPNAVTPHIDRDKAISEPMEAALKKIADLEAKLQKDAEDRDQNTKLSDLNRKVEDGFAQLKKDGWQDEGLKLVDTLMKEKGILDPMIAAAYVEKQHPQQEVVTPGGIGSWNFIESVQDGEADLKKLIETKGNSESLTDKMAREALAEIRGPSRR